MTEGSQKLNLKRSGANSSFVSDDASALMKFQNDKKSTGLTYLLWFFLGALGIHRFYLDRTGSAVVILLCTLSGMVFIFPLIVTAIFMIMDLFTIPSMVRSFNEDLRLKIQAGAM